MIMTFFLGSEGLDGSHFCICICIWVNGTSIHKTIHKKLLTIYLDKLDHSMKEGKENLSIYPI